MSDRVVAGLPAMIFNADHLDRPDKERILILEGEKKSIIVTQETKIPNIATMGMQSFKPEWTAKLAAYRTVYVCFDPDAIDKAVEVAGYFNGRGRVVSLPAKADDMFARLGANEADFMAYLRTARPVA